LHNLVSDRIPTLIYSSFIHSAKLTQFILNNKSANQQIRFLRSRFCSLLMTASVKSKLTRCFLMFTHISHISTTLL